MVLNEIGEKNKLKVNDEEVKKEIQKQVQSMPGQEKLILDYYKKNPSASQNIKGQIYEDKIIKFIKTKVDLKKIKVNLTEAQKIVDEFKSCFSKNFTKRLQRTKRQKSKKLVKVINSCIKIYYDSKTDEQMNNLIPMVVEQTVKARELMIFIQDFLKKELFFL